MSDLSLQKLKAHFWPLWYRLGFFCDLRSIARILKYRKLRGTYYDKLWAETAANIGAQIGRKSYGFTRINKDGLTTFVKLYQMMLDNPVMLDVIGNKGMTYQLLSELNAPVVPHVIFSMDDMAPAKEFLDTHKTVVVKPASGTGGGRGVTTGIETYDQFKSAARLAARFDKTVIIEKQIDGDSYRLLYLNGEFIDAIRRDPPTVIGDGVSSIKKLVKLENIRREKQSPACALSALVMDKDALNWLAANNIRLSHVPDKDQVIQVKRAVNENDERGNVNITQNVNPEIISRCGELVDKLGVKFAGVDLMCKDITGPFTSDNCYIGEINTTPGIHLHYIIDNPDEGNRVAEIVLDYMFSNKVGVLSLGTPGLNTAQNDEKRAGNDLKARKSVNELN